MASDACAGAVARRSSFGVAAPTDEADAVSIGGRLRSLAHEETHRYRHEDRQTAEVFQVGAHPIFRRLRAASRARIPIDGHAAVAKGRAGTTLSTSAGAVTPHREVDLKHGVYAFHET